MTYRLWQEQRLMQVEAVSTANQGCASLLQLLQRHPAAEP
jgi:hypothetical protein